MKTHLLSGCAGMWRRGSTFTGKEFFLVYGGARTPDIVLFPVWARSSNNCRFLDSFGFVMFGCWFCSLIIIFTGKASLCGTRREPLLEHRAPPVIAGRRGCQSSSTLPSSASPLVGTAAGGMTCCVAEGHRRCDPPEPDCPLSERGGPDPRMNLR